MGLKVHGIVEIGQLIKEHKFKSICMIGKQTILIDNRQYQFISNMFGINVKKKFGEIDSYDLFEEICGGGCEVHALDYSPYEGADIIFDLNSSALPDEYVGKFDLVIDGGTLEHVFNQYNAIKNINRLVRNGGFVYHELPCFGWVDHGFYSFSPTFFEDFYSHENGFQIHNLQFYMHEKKGLEKPATFSQDCRLFRNSTEINEYLLNNAALGRVIIRCIAQKINETNLKCPIQGMYQKIYQHKKVNYKGFIDLVKNEKKLSFYGCGRDCNLLFNELYKNDLQDAVDFVFDSDANKAGTLFRGKMVQYPTKLNLNKAENKILISSLKFEDEIFDVLVSYGVDSDCIIKISSLL